MNTSWPDNLSNNAIYNTLPDSLQNQALIDPSVFNAPNSIDVSQLQNQQFQARLQQNGAARNPYQVSPMVPSKRPREDSTGGSLSRSQTPQQVPFPGFQPGQQGGMPGMPGSNPYGHLQSTGNATPSPTMASQQFRQQGQQRMQTGSPSPFPQQATPTPANAPQNHNMGTIPGMNYMQSSPMAPQGYNQNFGMGMPAAGGMPVPSVPLTQNLQARQAQVQAQAQRDYQMRLQAAQMQMNAAQQRQQPGAMNAMMGMAGPQQTMVPGAGMQQMPNQKSQPEAFIRNVASLMQGQGRPFNPRPIVCGRPIHLMQLYAAVMKRRGSEAVTAANGWPVIAQMIGYHPQQFPNAGIELQMAYEQNLGPYEAAWFQKQKGLPNVQQGQMPGITTAPQMSPTKAMPSAQDLQTQQAQYMQALQQRSQSLQQQQQQLEQATPMKNNVNLATANGWKTPQTDPGHNRQASVLSQHRKSMSRPLEATPPHGQPQAFPTPSPGPVDIKQEAAPASEPAEAVGMNGIAGGKVRHGTNYDPKVRLLEYHGGIPANDNARVGADVAKLKPNVPSLEEMGVIDIRALCMSLQSGIHAEVRLALDVLGRLSYEPRVSLELEKCEDLIDALVECAEEQVDALADDAPEVSDVLDMSAYEDVIRNCHVERNAVQDIPEFGTRDYDLARAAERLIGITTILRNLSFFEFNHPLLSSPLVIKFLSNTIRLLGTRNMLLRSHFNTVDFMKDIVTFFSNTTDKIELPSREDAHNILHFLLAFAPSPPPCGRPLRFTAYNPNVHRYYPPAIDSLAKLLARDDPNRAYYKHVFAADANSSTPYDLLTRAFGLAIAVVPERIKLRGNTEIRIAEARKPYLTQGMLAADILASLAPGPETGIARSWLESEDGWAPSLLRFSVFLFSADRGVPPPPPPQQPGARQMQQRMDNDPNGFGLIRHRALSMLKRLGEKAGPEGASSVIPQLDGADDSLAVRAPSTPNGVEDDGMDVDEKAISRRLRADVLPKKEMLLGALLTPDIDHVALKQLCLFAWLDE